MSSEETKARGAEWGGHLNFAKAAIEIKRSDEHIGYVASYKEASKIIAAHNSALAKLPSHCASNP